MCPVLARASLRLLRKIRKVPGIFSLSSLTGMAIQSASSDWTIVDGFA